MHLAFPVMGEVAGETGVSHELGEVLVGQSHRSRSRPQVVKLVCPFAHQLDARTSGLLVVALGVLGGTLAAGVVEAHADGVGFVQLACILYRSHSRDYIFFSIASLQVFKVESIAVAACHESVEMAPERSLLAVARTVVFLVDVSRVILMLSLKDETLGVEQQTVFAVIFYRLVDDGHSRVVLVTVQERHGPVAAVGTVGAYQQRVAHILCHLGQQDVLRVGVLAVGGVERSLLDHIEVVIGIALAAQSHPAAVFLPALELG